MYGVQKKKKKNKMEMRTREQQQTVEARCLPDQATLDVSSPGNSACLRVREWARLRRQTKVVSWGIGNVEQDGEKRLAGGG